MVCGNDLWKLGKVMPPSSKSVLILLILLDIRMESNEEVDPQREGVQK